MEDSLGIPENQTATPVRNRPRRPAYVVLGTVLVLALMGLYWMRALRMPSSTDQEALMKAGLNLLYSGNDPQAAAAQFRKVLDLNPSHYGATYQLATALDRAGKPGEARLYWEKMLPMAQAIQDNATVTAVRQRLAVSPVTAAGDDPQQVAIMKAGLDELYDKKNAAAAAIEFRKVLAINPNHFGATYQLATALDRSGKPGEARPLWQKVVQMAEGYNDQQTVATARARLAQNP